MLKKTLCATGIIAAILVLTYIIYLIKMMYALGGYMFFLPNPPKPEIKRAEFPFRLEYEIEGETKIAEDILICEFNGFSSNEAAGKYRTWKSYFKSGNTRITLLQNDDIEIYYKPNINPQISGAYYMGDTEIYDSINETFPNALCTDDYEKIENNEREAPCLISAHDLWEKYKIKLISWNIAPPIQNSFK